MLTNWQSATKAIMRIFLANLRQRKKMIIQLYLLIKKAFTQHIVFDTAYKNT